MDSEERERREKLRNEWSRYTSRWAKMYEKEKAKRTAALGYDSEDEFQGMETVSDFEMVETMFSEVEEFA